MKAGMLRKASLECEAASTEKELDGETGLTYFGARYLDAEVGSWTALDQVRQYHHGYSFVGGDPVNYVDLWGLEGTSTNGKWDDSFWDLFQDRGGTWVENGSDRPSKSADASNVVVYVPQPKNYETRIQAPPPGHPAAEPMQHLIAREARDWYNERYSETGKYRYALGHSILSIYLLALPETEDEAIKSVVGGGKSTKVTKVVRATTVPRTFKSSDPLVADLANTIEKAYPGHVVGVNVPMRNATGQLVTGADILLQNAVIQVKSGSGVGLASQLVRTQSATSLPVIGYGPNLGGAVVKGVQSTGGLVTREQQLLINVVAP